MKVINDKDLLAVSGGEFPPFPTESIAREVCVGTGFLLGVVVVSEVFVQDYSLNSLLKIVGGGMIGGMMGLGVELVASELL